MNKKGYTLTELLIFVTFAVIVLAIIPIYALWTDRTLDFWCTRLSTHAVNVPYWLSLLVSIILNSASLVGNIISEITRLCI